MREIKELEIYNATYQRNGVSGVGFYVIKFTFREDGEKGRRIPATAVLFGDCRNNCHEGCCAILTDNLQQHWRGDHFEPELREWLTTDEARRMIWPMLS